MINERLRVKFRIFLNYLTWYSNIVVVRYEDYKSEISDVEVFICCVSVHYMLWVSRGVYEIRESSRKFLVGILTFLVMQNLGEYLGWVRGNYIVRLSFIDQFLTVEFTLGCRNYWVTNSTSSLMEFLVRKATHFRRRYLNSCEVN